MKFKLSKYLESVDLSTYDTEIDEVLLFAMRTGRLHRIRKDIYHLLRLIISFKFDLKSFFDFIRSLMSTT